MAKKKAAEADARPKREHKSAKRSGYDTDGENYWIAPMHRQSYDDIENDRSALQSMLNAFNEYAHRAHKHHVIRQRAWWDSVCDDLGLDRALPWTYAPYEGRISLMKPEEPEAR